MRLARRPGKMNLDGWLRNPGAATVTPSGHQGEGGRHVRAPVTAEAQESHLNCVDSSDEVFEEELAQYNAELAADLSSADFGPRTDDEHRRSVHRERCVSRRGLRLPIRSARFTRSATSSESKPMSYKTFIEWCHHTFNPWWGCVKISQACKRCYAASHAGRFGHKVWGARAPRRLASPKAWKEPLRWDTAARAAGKRERVFCLSMGDVFEDRRDLDSARALLWALIAATPNLDWLLLTKRPENIAKLVPWGATWPTNVWLGVTAETQENADQRIPLILQYPAAVHFVSAEPLLEAISLTRYLVGERRVGWVIAGGESGPGARPSDPDWFRSLRDECVQHDVPFFFKQWGNHAPAPTGGLVRLRSKKDGGRALDGCEWNQIPEPWRP